MFMKMLAIHRAMTDAASAQTPHPGVYYHEDAGTRQQDLPTVNRDNRQPGHTEFLFAPAASLAVAQGARSHTVPSLFRRKSARSKS